MMKTATALLVSGAMGANPVIHPPQEVPAGWQVTGENADMKGSMDIMVGMKRSNMGKLQSIFEESSTPGRPGYLQHLSWKEMGDLIRPSNEAMGAVIGMLAAHGGTNLQIAPHGDYIKATLPKTTLETLTGSSFQTYVNPSTGSKIYRLADGVSLPPHVAKYVETFTGAHGFPLEYKAQRMNSTADNSVTPTIINQAYGIDAKTFARHSESNIQAIGQFQGQMVSPLDLSDFCKQFDSEADCSIKKFIGQNIGSEPGIESMLDVEYITGLAKSVDTWVYSYPSFNFCADLLTWANDVASESQHPSVISLSYASQKIGFCDSATVQRLSSDVQKLGAMGITVTIASGDDGSGDATRQGDNNGKLSPAFPASIPYALAVGSTFFDSGLSGEEQATTQFGSGGGFSYDYDAPSYQADAVKGYLAQNPLIGSKEYKKTGRASPDVSLLGEQFEIIVGRDQTMAVGGTSASTPSWGAVISLLNDDCLAASGGKKTLGFVNPLFYQNPDAFNDITQGSNAIGENSASGWKATKGWDAATGLGTPNFPKLQAVVKKACGASSVVV